MTTEQKPKIFELEACTLFAGVEGNKRASLTWSLRERYPRISVFTRTQSDNDGRGVLTAAFDLEHWLIFLNRLERVARSEGEHKEVASVLHWPRDQANGGKITGDREVTAEVYFGKDHEGIVWISVVQPNRPKIVFKIELSEYHKFRNSKGEPLSPSEGSIARTIAMCTILKDAYMRQAATFRDTSIPRENKGPYSQRKGGARSDAYSNATQQKLSDEFTESDIPF